MQEIRDRIIQAATRARRDVAQITLIGASKTVDAARLPAFYHAGLHDFGENYIQEGVQKVHSFREQGLNATWHFIGALQSNKARDAVAHFDWIHSVDRLSLARELDKEAHKIGKIQTVFLQVNMAGEASKAGAAPKALRELLEAMASLQNLRVEGLMSLPPFEENPENSRPYHRQLRQLRDDLAPSFPFLRFLSMGMSNDFPIAIEEGATHVRIGTAIFGSRR